MATKHTLKQADYLDLAYNPNQKRDGNGRWTSGASISSASVTTLTSVSNGKVTRDSKVSAAKATLLTKKGKKGEIEARVAVWQMTREEKTEILADIADDPLKDASDEDLFKHLHGSDPAMKAKALSSLEARRKRYELLAKAAHDGLTTEKTQEAVARWDSKVSKLPGGKGLIKLRDRFLNEKSVIKAGERAKKVKHVGKEFALHAAVGSALVALAAGAAGIVAMKHGGGPEAVEHAQHAIEHWLHGGTKVGSVPIREIGAWLGVQAAIGGIGRKAALSRQYAKKAAAKAPWRRSPVT